MDRDTVTWIVGGLVVAGTVYYFYRRRQAAEEDEAGVQAETASLGPSNLVHFPGTYSEQFQ